jgi:hypothetical protein
MSGRSWRVVCEGLGTGHLWLCVSAARSALRDGSVAGADAVVNAVFLGVARGVLVRRGVV